MKDVLKKKADLINEFNIINPELELSEKDWNELTDCFIEFIIIKYEKEKEKI